MSRKRLFFIIFLFLLIGLLSEFLLWKIERSDACLAIMAPVLTAAHLLENSFPFFTTLPPIQNELTLVLPLTLLYFGIVGFWISKIFTEEGFLKFLTLLAFLGFVVIIHWQALSYVQSILSAQT